MVVDEYAQARTPDEVWVDDGSEWGAAGSGEGACTREAQNGAKTRFSQSRARGAQMGPPRACRAPGGGRSRENLTAESRRSMIRGDETFIGKSCSEAAWFNNRMEHHGQARCQSDRVLPAMLILNFGWQERGDVPYAIVNGDTTCQS